MGTEGCLLSLVLVARIITRSWIMVVPVDIITRQLVLERDGETETEGQRDREREKEERENEESNRERQIEGEIKAGLAH